MIALAFVAFEYGFISFSWHRVIVFCYYEDHNDYSSRIKNNNGVTIFTLPQTQPLPIYLTSCFRIMHHILNFPAFLNSFIVPRRRNASPEAAWQLFFRVPQQKAKTGNATKENSSPSRCSGDFIMIIMTNSQLSTKCRIHVGVDPRSAEGALLRVLLLPSLLPRLLAIDRFSSSDHDTPGMGGGRATLCFNTERRVWRELHRVRVDRYRVRLLGGDVSVCAEL